MLLPHSTHLVTWKRWPTRPKKRLPFGAADEGRGTLGEDGRDRARRRRRKLKRATGLQIKTKDGRVMGARRCPGKKVPLLADTGFSWERGFILHERQDTMYVISYYTGYSSLRSASCGFQQTLIIVSVYKPWQARRLHLRSLICHLLLRSVVWNPYPLQQGTAMDSSYISDLRDSFGLIMLPLIK